MTMIERHREAGGGSLTPTRSQQAPADRLTIAGSVLLVLALIMIISGWAGVLVVFGDHPVPGWLLGAALLIMSGVITVIGTLRRRAGRSVSGRLLPRRLTVIIALLVAGGSVVGAFGDLGSRYHVLEPAAPDGCRVAVRESAFLMAGRGAAYAVPVWGIGLRKSSWTSDDGYQPIAAGTYKLQWSEYGGLLVVHGRPGDPVSEALHEVDC